MTSGHLRASCPGMLRALHGACGHATAHDGRVRSHAIIMPVQAAGVLVERLGGNASVDQAGQQPREHVSGILLAQVPTTQMYSPSAWGSSWAQVSSKVSIGADCEGFVCGTAHNLVRQPSQELSLCRFRSPKHAGRGPAGDRTCCAPGSCHSGRQKLAPHTPCAAAAAAPLSPTWCIRTCSSMHPQQQLEHFASNYDTRPDGQAARLNR